jgi:hypothetical protein
VRGPEGVGIERGGGVGDDRGNRILDARRNPRLVDQIVSLWPQSILPTQWRAQRLRKPVDFATGATSCTGAILDGTIWSINRMGNRIEPLAFTLSTPLQWKAPAGTQACLRAVATTQSGGDDERSRLLRRLTTNCTPPSPSARVSRIAQRSFTVCRLDRLPMWLQSA